jgi:TolB protein
MKKTISRFWLTRVALLAACGFVTSAQNSDIIVNIVGNGDRPKLALPDFRGAGDAQSAMNTFNGTLWDELSGSGVLALVPKTFYPLEVPQQPADFKAPTTTTPVRRGQQPETVRNGPWLTDWSGAPTAANYLAFGYAGVQDGRMVLFGWLYNLSQPTPAAAQTIGKLYFGLLNDEGARKVAHEFAADILAQFNAVGLAGSKIFFVSDRTGNKEIWSMDYDGSNQKQLTNYKSISSYLGVSPNGKLYAFTTYARGNPQIMIHSAETGKRLTFLNPVSPVVTTPEFSPDGKKLYFAASIDGWTQLCVADVDGGNMERLSHVRAIEVSPKINPKTARDMLFISGRSGGPGQLYHMNLDGSELERLTPGTGEVGNPAWQKDGRFIAFAWTAGYEIGAFNIFIMDIGTKTPIQLTHGNGVNENPWWAPDGLHIVFSIKKGRSTQLYSMLADGTNVQQLTTQGNNLQPVWVKGIN